MKWLATMSEDPWKDLAPASLGDEVNARRVDASLPWHFFWARGVDGKYLLVLRHSAGSTPHNSLPRLRGIEVTLSTGEGDSGRILAFKLLDNTHRDIFHRLCLDIVEGASDAKTEAEAVDVSLARTWRWHHLLRGGTDQRLSSEEQKGLIGELLVLERYLIPVLGPGDSVRSWRGPLDAPKDFEVGRISIESKARSGASTPVVEISSEFQLDDSGIDELLLHVVELGQAPSTLAGACSVTDVARRVRSIVSSIDEAAADVLDGLLAAVGFRWDDDYSDFLWIEGPSRIYQVREGFPRLTPPLVGHGVLRVKYAIELMECEGFKISDGAFTNLLKGIRDAH